MRPLWPQGEFVTYTLILALVFAVLLGLEWRHRRRGLRLGTVALALIILWLAQPNITAAARRASAAPPEARIRVYGKDTLSAYMSGVDLMREYVSEQYNAAGAQRALALGTLAWLAASPAFRRRQTATCSGVVVSNA
jgi:hypothetical protein